jgi:hypothetical protein
MDFRIDFEVVVEGVESEAVEVLLVRSILT